MLQEIARLHFDGQLDEAAVRYRALLVEQPDNVDALHLFGTLLRQRGAFDEAATLLAKACGLAPERADVRVELAGVRLLEHDAAAARELAEAAVRLDPNQRGAHTLLGQIALIEGDLATAESRYRTALRVDEDDANALAGLGHLHLERGQADMALRYLTRAAELAPGEALIQFSVGRALHANGNAAFAERALENALRLRPDFHPARHLLGQLLIEQRRPQEAEAQFAALGETPAHRLVGLLGLADAARGQGRLEDAIVRYREALALDSRQPRAVQALGSCLIQLGRDDEALAAYHAYLVVVPDDRLILAALGDFHILRGRLDEGRAAWRRLLEAHPDESVAALRLALLAERAGDFAEAAACAVRAARRHVDDPELALLNLRSALREGDDAAARRQLDVLARLALNPGQARLAEHYQGLVFDRAGAPAAAVEAWLRAQADLPIAVQAQEALPEELAARLAEPAPPAETMAPVFLLGLPGSQVERVAALLAQQPGLTLLRDRAVAVLREDDFHDPDFPAYLAGLTAEDAAARRARWERERARLGPPAGRPVEWLPRWDARFLPLLRQAFPGALVLVVGRDPRDELLNWIAYGWMPGFPMVRPETAAHWLAKARVHLDVCRSAAGLDVRYVDADALLADPAGHGAPLAAALGLPALDAGPPQLGLGGLPLGLPAGRWQAYAKVLADAFASLPSRD